MIGIIVALSAEIAADRKARRWPSLLPMYSQTFPS